jgi:alpha-methylacyl-CoA racemase
VGAIEPHFYANLCTALGCEQYVSHQMDDEKQDEIREAFKQAFLKRDRDDWAAELGPGNCCVAPVKSIPELVDDPQWQSRGIFMEAEHPEHGRFKQVGPILAGGERKQPLHTVRPSTQTDTLELLREAGLGDEEIDALRNEGAVE